MAIEAFAKLKVIFAKIPSAYWLAIGLAFLCLLIVSYYSIDPDFGWHLQSGLHYLQHGIPQYDVFTYAASNFPWINHEWLNDSIIATLYRLGGYGLVAVFFASVWTIALILASRKHSAAVLVFGALTVMPFAGIRPVAWTVLFVAILERTLNSRHTRHTYFLPLLFLIWANLHGSFVLGLGLLTLWQLFSKKRLPWIPVGLSFLAVLINPYGPRIFEEIFRTAADSRLRFRINEWQMIALPLLSVVYVVFISAFHLVFNKKPIKSLFSIPGLMFALTLSSIRHLPVFVVTSLRYLEDYFEMFTRQITKLKLDKPRLAFLCLIIGLPVITGLYFAITNLRNITSQNSGYPDPAISYLKANGCPGEVFNSYNYGGYLIWKFPERKVYIDGRMPSWKHQGVDYFSRYEQVFASDEYRRGEFQKFNIRCVLLNKADDDFKLKRAVPFGQQLLNEKWLYVKEASTNNTSLYLKTEPW